MVLTGDCNAGYLCESAATTATPTDGTTGDRCPAGSYCLAGTPTATPCPHGTYSNSVGLAAEAECTDCDAGSYCTGTIM